MKRNKVVIDVAEGVCKRNISCSYVVRLLRAICKPVGMTNDVLVKKVKCLIYLTKS